MEEESLGNSKLSVSESYLHRLLPQRLPRGGGMGAARGGRCENDAVKESGFGCLVRGRGFALKRPTKG